MSALADSRAPASLAAAGLPVRVRRTLERSLALVSEELDPGMGRMLVEFERELFRLADLARNPGSETGYMQALRGFRLNRADLLPRLMIEIESALARMRRQAEPPPPAAEPGPPSFRDLALVETSIMDENTVLREIAGRQEGRATLALHLLSQRFGVLAGAPAFDTERLPLGPHALCRAIRSSAVELEIGYDARLLLYRMFDRQVMSTYPLILDRLNELMVAEGILPALTFVPMRTRAAPIESGSEAGPEAKPAADTAAGSARKPAEPSEHAPQQALHTGWFDRPRSAGNGEDDDAAFAMLRQLLSGRRDLIGKLRSDTPRAAPRQMNTQDLVGALAQLQTQPAGGRGDLSEVKRTVLARARQRDGEGSALSQRDSDTFELVDLLYGQIENEVRADAPTAPLIQQLQLPLLRAALLDHTFFLHPHHPARQLLNTIAESAARWLDDNAFDPAMLAPLREAVAEVVGTFEQDPAVFARVNERLHERMQLLARKSETLERRHVEAARGKEKLEVARLRSADVLEHLIGDQRLPKFARALLNQAWSDVLTLTLLRQGEESDAWEQQLDATRSIIQACLRDDAPDAPELTAHVESSLGQVGYHDDEATAIARRLTRSGLDDANDPASRTELAMQLKARVRLGEDKIRSARPDLPPRTPAEQAQYEQLRVLPFGCWMEFVSNQQGDLVRRRLSWYSRITDNALFVNQRGQRVAEYTLDTLARMMATGQARLVTAQRGRLVDRAWQAAVSALRSFAGRGDERGATGEAPA